MAEFTPDEMARLLRNKRRVDEILDIVTSARAVSPSGGVRLDKLAWSIAAQRGFTIAEIAAAVGKDAPVVLAGIAEVDSPTSRVDVRRLWETVAKAHGVEVGDILGRSRKRLFITARRDVAKILRTRGLSYPAIGRILNRHHTSVMSILELRG